MAIGNPVAFEASADERETRGFISIRTWRPVRGSTANWMFEPPVSTPTARMHASAASRIRWYSRSDSVITGATVIESPVCTPIGSTFSIEQITTALSAPSRITSSSNSFHPATDSSTRISVTGLAARLRLATRSSSARVRANPLPPPPRVNDGPDDQRVPELVPELERPVERARGPRARRLEPGPAHRLLEAAAVLGAVDRLEPRPDQPDAQPLEVAGLRERDRDVQRGLAAERRQQHVGSLALDHLQDGLGRERFDVRAVRELGVGHDRGRVRVHERHVEPLAPQHLAGLGPRVVELARLPDHDRARADHQDAVQVGALRHQAAAISARNSSNR